MTAYIIRRLLLGLFIIWGVYTLTFFAVNLAPGDAFSGAENPKMKEEDFARLRAKWGYDKPIFQRYAHQIVRMFWGEEESDDYAGGGYAFEVFSQDKEGRIRAGREPPATTITLVHYQEDVGDTVPPPVTVEAAADGTFAVLELAEGHYEVKGKPFRAGNPTSSLRWQGLTIRNGDGGVVIEKTLVQPADELVLNATDGQPLTLKRNADGSYGPAAAQPDQYQFKETRIVVPVDPLDETGLRFSLGTSILNRTPVLDHLAEPLWNTLKLALLAIILNFIVGIVIGVISAVKQDTMLDHGITVGALFVYSMPGFWLGLMIILTFAVRLDWLPTGGMNSVGEDGFFDTMWHMIGPAFVLGIAGAAGTARYQRSAMLEVMGQDYIRTARAKGLGERKVIFKHALRNSLLPVITLFGLWLPFLVSGAVITEYIFTWPGMGREAIAAIVGRDVTLVTAITLIGTVMVVAGSLIADILYAVADPRVRLK